MRAGKRGHFAGAEAWRAPEVISGALKRGKCGPFIPICATRLASIFQFVIVLTRDIQAWLIDLARLPAALTHQNERNRRVVWMQGV